MIVPISSLKPLELVLPTHLQILSSQISVNGTMNKPIIADRKTGIILDGSHRYAFLLANGYKEAPVHFVDYMDENIRVGSRLSERFFVNKPTISKGICIKAGLSGNLLPARTTRHFFPFRKKDSIVQLSVLRKGSPVDISYLLEDISLGGEIKKDLGYIQELVEEFGCLSEYLGEVNETKAYLEGQVKIMKSIEHSIFPGKFQPPHYGHFATIRMVLKNNPNLTIGVSEDIPSGGQFMPVSKVIKQLQTVFPDIKVVRIKGVMTNYKSIDEFAAANRWFSDEPFYKVISGNPKVLRWANKLGFTTEKVKRSGKVSGTQIRKKNKK